MQLVVMSCAVPLVGAVVPGEYGCHTIAFAAGVNRKLFSTWALPALATMMPAWCVAPRLTSTVQRLIRNGPLVIASNARPEGLARSRLGPTLGKETGCAVII